MTRPVSELREALALTSQGQSPTEIARVTGIPRSTVRDWAVGRIPTGRDRAQNGCNSCGHPAHNFTELPSAYAYLLGLYLGDGTIARHPRAYKLRIFLDVAYPKIIGEATTSMRQVKDGKVNAILRAKGCSEVYSYSKAWPCLFPQHGPGKKHLRRIELVGWQKQLVQQNPELLLRGLIHSDGCRFLNTGKGWSYPRYSFSNHSDDIRQIFTFACDLVGLRWTTAPHVVYVSRKADVDRMDTFIGPKT